MLALTTAQQDAIAARRVMRRLFVHCDALDPVTGDPSPGGFWNDVGTVSVTVNAVERTYVGSGSLIAVRSLSLASDLTIPGLEIVLSGLSAEVAATVRGDTVGQRPVDLMVGLFDPSTHALAGPLIPRFDGFVDDIVIETPEAGGDSTIRLICESTSRALTISRTATRSEATAHERDPDDDFYRYTNLQREKPLYFGRKTPRSEPRSGGGGRR